MCTRIPIPGVDVLLLAQEDVITEWESKLPPTLGNSPILQRIAHGTGGPVAQHDWMILNRCSFKDLSLCILHEAKLIHTRDYSKDLGQELLPGVFLGRDVSSIFSHGGTDEANNMVSHQVIHGHAEWFVGQLQSEVKRGLWITKQNASEILLSTPPHELWHALIRD
jgi:putative AlgH/UPF0301 family transcriptional regulator